LVIRAGTNCRPHPEKMLQTIFDLLRCLTTSDFGPLAEMAAMLIRLA
jgi:hypothetical protein